MMETQTQPRDALAEGRRIYLGNLLYSVKPTDIEDLLRQSGFDESFEKLHISIDPVSGRNPGYCFAEFTTRDEADRALDSLAGILLFNRPVKVGPCHPKTQQQTQSRWRSNRGDDYNPTFQRWGDWKGNAEDVSMAQQGPQGAIRNLDERSDRVPDNASLYIGGLDKMINQEHHDTEMQELLAGFDYVAIGKRITPHPSTRELPGNHHYCFVHFSSAEEAKRAMDALNNAPFKGGNLRVSIPKTKSPAFAKTGTNHSWRGSAERASPASGPRQESRRQDGQDGQERRGPTEKQRSIMTSNNWRSGAGAN